MAFDYKKEYKEYYMPKNKPSIVSIPQMNYIAIEVMVILMKRMEIIKIPLVYYIVLLILLK